MGLLGMAAKGPSPTRRLMPQPHLAVSSLAASVALIHCFLNTRRWLTSPSSSPRQWPPPAPQSKTKPRHESTQLAETKTRSMEEEVIKLQKCLQDKDGQLCSSTSSTEQYHHELDDLRTHLSFTQATGEAGEQLDLLQKDVQAREVTQMQLKDIVIRIETNIMDEVAKAFEIAMLRGEIRILSTHWTNKTKNLESQLKKHQRTDQELKKRVLKLEFCLWSCHPLVWCIKK
ncbi:hypothetical protein ZEAMMB73_Zm00001d002875 [Zea mays]|uniref:Uncharacterized protein n=1 Tax=Zea mays TaxID=4577 RepID=A0A1D6E4Z1_MAIZE|nr:hypothetical protein ZEAMMB73_Zm00001d002875 [Zea mays]